MKHGNLSAQSQNPFPKMGIGLSALFHSSTTTDSDQPARVTMKQQSKTRLNLFVDEVLKTFSEQYGSVLCHGKLSYNKYTNCWYSQKSSSAWIGSSLGLFCDASDILRRTLNPNRHSFYLRFRYKDFSSVLIIASSLRGITR